MGVTEGDLSIDVDVILGNCTIPFRKNLNASKRYRLYVFNERLLVVYLTLTDPLRIQPWSQDRRNQTKSNRKSEISRESTQKRTDKKIASKGHRRDNKKTQTKTHRQ